MKITQKSRIEYLRKGIATKNQWARRALILVYNNQTTHEQSVQGTVEHNGVGFTGTDASFCSSLAEQLLFKKSLSPKQDAMIMKIMPKYAKQVLEQTNLEVLDELILKQEVVNA